MELLIPLVFVPGSRLVILLWTNLRAFLFGSGWLTRNELFVLTLQKGMPRANLAD